MALQTTYTSKPAFPSKKATFSYQTPDPIGYRTSGGDMGRSLLEYGGYRPQAPAPAQQQQAAQPRYLASNQSGAPVYNAQAATQQQAQPSANYAPGVIDADPAMQMVRAMNTENLAAAEASAGARRRQIVLDLGDEELGKTVLGNDESFLKATRENPLSALARIKDSRKTETTDLEEALNRANLFYSGYRGNQLAELDKSILGREANARGAAKRELSDIDAMLIAAKRGANSDLLNVLQGLLGRLAAGGGFGGGGGDGGGDPTVDDAGGAGWLDLLLAGQGPLRGVLGSQGPF